MSTVLRWFFAGLGLAVGLSGCQQYFSIEEACREIDKVPGQRNLDGNDVALESVLRLNCHRRVAGLSRARIHPQVQDAVDGHMNYIDVNPTIDPLLTGGAIAYLDQDFDGAAFTGANLTERLEDANYVFFDRGAVTVEEFLVIDGGDPADLPSGALGIDRLMRTWPWRERGLQRSWLDGGYYELDLASEWLKEAELCDSVLRDILEKAYPGFSCSDEGDVSGFQITMYYLLVIHNRPPVEKMARPMIYPKHQQEGVPLYADAFDPATGLPVQISYPITIFGNALLPENYLDGSSNVFGIRVAGAGLVRGGSGGTPIQTFGRLPGQAKEGVFPSGLLSSKSAAVWAAEPFEPDTTYTFFSEIETNEGSYDVNIEFTTASQDLGLWDGTTTGKTGTPEGTGGAVASSTPAGPGAWGAPETVPLPNGGKILRWVGSHTYRPDELRSQRER